MKLIKPKFPNIHDAIQKQDFKPLVPSLILRESTYEWFRKDTHKNGSISFNPEIELFKLSHPSPFNSIDPQLPTLIYIYFILLAAK